MKTLSAIWTVIKRFFRWPYSVYAILVGYGLFEYIFGQKLNGIVTMGLGVWAFLIEYNRPKA